MVELGILIERLRSLHRLYEGAVSGFAERIRKIEAGEDPYEPPAFDPDRDDPEPAFLQEWTEADEFQNIIGQACINILHTCLKSYMDEVLRRSRIKNEAEKFLSRRRNEVKGEGWFERYLALFADAYRIDWSQCPVRPEEIEQINLVRNDIQHGRAAFGLNLYQSEQHTRRFPQNLFMDDFERNLPPEDRVPGWSRIYVSGDALQKSILRVETFCRFIEDETAGRSR